MSVVVVRFWGKVELRSSRRLLQVGSKLLQVRVLISGCCGDAGGELGVLQLRERRSGGDDSVCSGRVVVL